MEKTISFQLSKFASELRSEDVPDEILLFVKCLTLKTISGMLAGSRKPSGMKMAKLVKEKQLPSEVKIIGSDFKAPLWEAVLANAFFAHASELEDDRFEDGISWDITVIPLLLSLGQKHHLSGRKMLEALVAGLEIHARTCFFSARHMKMTVIPGSVGPAVAGAKALGMGVREMVSAMGLSLSGPTITDVNLGYDGHFYESALQSLQGMIAAEMAGFGMTGSPDLSDFLYHYLGSERVKIEKMIEAIGEKWVLKDIQVKKYPCCLMMHRQIDSIVELKKMNGISYSDVECIEIHASPGDTILNRPEPVDENDAQFSLQHALACAIIDGDVGLEHLTREAVENPKIKEARSKVNFILDPDLDSRWLKARSSVTIKTKDNRAFTHERQYQVGHPKDPLSEKKFIELYEKFARGSLETQIISKTADMVLNMEKIEDMDSLMTLL